jgi:hypothetical protein
LVRSRLKQVDEHSSVLLLRAEEHGQNADQAGGIIDREPVGGFAKRQLP